MINVLQLAAGQGSRFIGYSELPKPFIDVNGKPMFVRAVESIGIEDANYHYLFQRKHINNYNPNQYINGQIHSIDYYTDGAATSAYHVIKNSPHRNQGWLIIDCDGIIKWNKKIDSINSGIFVEHHPWDSKSSYSYVDIDSSDILCTAEKQCISDYRNSGQYYWSSGDLFCECYEFYRDNGLRTLNEFYLSTLYNAAIKLGERVRSIQIDRFINMGTPDDLKRYLEELKNEN
jgi:UDP-N-acetylglucosamine diphosphorylase / glucose-1-phosphate thymidylyltransferase / UDP-N-acetylgalactosamine diphosphorylase / glucosamine-1-phosphate N-acetyltransferase / galactosamine-1-phosphate N-acetyltransferase